jgi:uncharacterized membrane protein YqgA involved in biofilm formation
VCDDSLVLLGTLANGACIIIGALLGNVFRHIPEKVKDTVMSGIGLSVLLLGVQMGLKSEQFLIVICSLVIGGVLGEFWDIEGKLNDLGKWVEKKMGYGSEGMIAKGFVSATLLFVIGSMAIVGALHSGLRGDHLVLYTKSILDGFTSVILTATFGIGVIFSAVPVVLYEGTIALLATQIEQWIPQSLLNSFIIESTATGGVLIMAIGLNMLRITSIRVANLLPSILMNAIIIFGIHIWDSFK